MGTSDRTFWDLVKEIGGLESSRSAAAPDAEALAEHFANKMTSGKARADDSFSTFGMTCHPLHEFKIRFKNVLKALRGLDPSKSSNGTGPVSFASVLMSLLRWSISSSSSLYELQNILRVGKLVV